MTQRRRVPWTNEEEQFLIDNADTMGTVGIAESLGRTNDDVQSRLRLLRAVQRLTERRNARTLDEFDPV